MYLCSVKNIKTGRNNLLLLGYFCNFDLSTEKERMMNKTKRLFGCVFLLLALLATSCSNKNVFDEDDYRDIVEREQPVDGIDESHTWTLTSTYYMTASIPETAQDAERLLILSGNPANGESAMVLGEYFVTADEKKGEKKYFSFVASNLLLRFYAALVDTDGTYTIVAFSPSTNRNISFLQPLATKVEIASRLIGRQTFSYCFEDEMPEPGDYDYNDVVLRISQERTAVNQITLNVTLAAVGSLSQVAAAIRLTNINFEDVESIKTSDGETFNDGYKKSSLPYIESEDLLIKGKNDAAVINLFEDAHWATGAAHYASEGYIPRYKYNVSKTTSTEHDMMSPRTISYEITFKESVDLDYFTLERLDPFVILEYNGALMEVHAAYNLRLETVLHDYVQPTSAVILPWALIIPSGSFRYPLDGVNIGFSKNEALFGAYMTEGHAFGEWASSHEKALDWYNYPTSNMVY